MKTQNWPAWHYGPQGQAAVFQRADDVPDGWRDSPAVEPPAEPPFQPADIDAAIEALAPKPKRTRKR